MNGDFDTRLDLQDRMASLRNQLGAYVYYCSCLLKVFVDRGSGTKWDEGNHAIGAFVLLEELTKARQELETSPELAVSTVNRAWNQL